MCSGRDSRTLFPALACTAPQSLAHFPAGKQCALLATTRPAGHETRSVLYARACAAAGHSSESCEHCAFGAAGYLSERRRLSSLARLYAALLCTFSAQAPSCLRRRRPAQHSRQLLASSGTASTTLGAAMAATPSIRRPLPASRRAHARRSRCSPAVRRAAGQNYGHRTQSLAFQLQ